MPSNTGVMLALPAYHNEGSSDLTLTVLGCGTMGIAILSGIFTSLQERAGPQPLQRLNTPSEELPPRLPSRFIACVRRPESAKKVKQALWEHSSSLKVVLNDNVHSVAKSDVVLLSCKSAEVQELLSEPGMSKALHGKLLVSICAGVTVPQIEKALHGAVPVLDPEVDGRCRIIRAVPNTASMIRESMTVIATSTPPLPRHIETLVTWIFKRVGAVVYLPPDNMDAATAVCASGPALFALMLEAVIDGAVAIGLPRPEATHMATQSMRGCTGLVQHGDHPALLRDRITTPGGCTIAGLMKLEEGSVRSAIAHAVREAAVAASQQGQNSAATDRYKS